MFCFMIGQQEVGKNLGRWDNKDSELWYMNKVLSVFVSTNFKHFVVP